MATHEQDTSPLPIKTPRGYDKASELLHQTARREQAVRELEAMRDRALAPHNDEIKRIKTVYADEISALTPQIDQGLRALWRWYRRNLKRYGKGGRTIDLPSGVLGMQLDSVWTVEVVGEEAEVIEDVRRRGLRFLKIKVELNKDAIGADRRRFRKINGLRIHRFDRFFAKPIALQNMKEPKENRLRTPVKDLTQ